VYSQSLSSVLAGPSRSQFCFIYVFLIFSASFCLGVLILCVCVPKLMIKSHLISIARSLAALPETGTMRASGISLNSVNVCAAATKDVPNQRQTPHANCATVSGADDAILSATATTASATTTAASSSAVSLIAASLIIQLLLLRADLDNRELARAQMRDPQTQL
jgi:hypothetical protein